MRARLKMVVMVIMVIHDGDGDCHGGGGAYLRVTNENFAIVQKNCSLLKRI